MSEGGGQPEAGENRRQAVQTQGPESHELQPSTARPQFTAQTRSQASRPKCHSLREVIQGTHGVFLSLSSFINKMEITEQASQLAELSTCRVQKQPLARLRDRGLAVTAATTTPGHTVSPCNRRYLTRSIGHMGLLKVKLKLKPTFLSDTSHVLSAQQLQLHGP